MTAIVGIDADVVMVLASTVAAETKGGVKTCVVNNGGSSYAIGDTATLTGNPTGTGGKIRVTDVAAGVVTALEIIQAGENYTNQTGIATVSGDGGTGLTVNITYSKVVPPTWNPTTQVWDLQVNGTDYTWTQITERNEISINISVDVAEHKVFVTNINNAWVEKARLYMDWSGSLSGYYDDANNDIFNTMKAGLDMYVMIIDSKAHITATEQPTKYWVGKVLLTSVDHSIPNEDFSTLDVDFEGNGALYRNQLP